MPAEVPSKRRGSKARSDRISAKKSALARRKPAFLDRIPARKTASNAGPIESAAGTIRKSSSRGMTFIASKMGAT